MNDTQKWTSNYNLKIVSGKKIISKKVLLNIKLFRNFVIRTAYEYMFLQHKIDEKK